MGTIVFGFGGIEFAVPLLFFFISSSLFSRLRSPNKVRAADLFDKAGPRDIRQVAANGGIATLAVLIYGLFGIHELFYIYLASISEAAADTWATEIGTLSKSEPVSIISFRKTEPGTSGSITAIGTLAALAGSLATAYSAQLAIIFFNRGTMAYPGYFAAAWICGFLGSMADSVLGATLQVQYKCPVCKKITEKRTHCGAACEPIRGLGWIENDMVNFLATASAGSLMFIILWIAA